jgi:PAS domain S-box-containing protein
MYTQLRKSGIEILGDIPWGSHFCQFYETKKDLLELLVPYFKAGLENNEYCLWVTCDPMTTEEAFLALKKAVPEFETYVKKKSIEILPHMDWFFVTGKFNTQQLNEAWIRKLDEALVKGYDGMRINGNETWLREGDWDNFMKYEHGLNKILSERRIIGLCTYPLSYSNGKMMLDVAHAHERIISKRKGEWEVLETPLPIQAQSKLNKLNQEIRKIKKRPSNLSSILSYGIAVLSVAVALIILLMSTPQLFNDGSYVSLFLCAVILSSWFGGVRPGLLAVVLSLLAFDYFFLSPLNSFSIEANEIPRLLFFLIPAIFVVWLTATQKNIINLFRRTRGVLEWTVQKLDHSNTALREENEERKRAELEISRQVELTTEIIHTIPTMIWCVLPDGKLDFVNQPWMDYTGLSLDEAKEEPFRIIHPEDLPNVMKKWEMNRDAGNYHEDEMRLRRADGEYRWFLVRTAPLRDKEGSVVKWYGVSIEIEERKKIEEKLRQSESLLMEAEDLAHVGSWSLDLSSKTVTWSDELYKIFGVDPSGFDKSLEGVIGFTHPADKDFIIQIVEKAIATHEPNDFHYRMIRPDGDERILHVRLAVMTNEEGSPTRIYGAVQDVTERKKAEDELRRAYQRLSYHVENTPLAVIERDKDLNITRWSGQAEKIFGWSASEVLGKNMYDRDFPIVYRDDKEKVAEVDYELTNGLIDRNLILNRNYTKDGKVIYCEWYNSVLRDEQGNVVTILSLTHDVTERKEAEEKLNTSYEQIRSLSEHLTNVREVERKHIAREIHDELGQELTVLKMDVGSLVKKLPLTDDIMRKRLASFSGLIDNIVQSVRRIASELRPSLLDDLGLTAAIAWHMEEFEKRSGIKSHFKEPKDEWILPDPVKINLFRIVQEATTNIGRHSNATEVHVNLEHNDHSIVLRVFDNGVGFNAETICKGNTLGILGMRERASIVGGKLEIKTAPGNGTEIFVSVPAAVNK